MMTKQEKLSIERSLLVIPPIKYEEVSHMTPEEYRESLINYIEEWENKHYTTVEMSEALSISTTAVDELRKKLKLKTVNARDYLRIKDWVEDIKKRMKRVTTSSINEYMILKEKDEKCVRLLRTRKERDEER